MAIGLEPEFLGARTAKTLDPAGRSLVSTGSGEEFAISLRQARGETADRVAPPALSEAGKPTGRAEIAGAILGETSNALPAPQTAPVADHPIDVAIPPGPEPEPESSAPQFPELAQAIAHPEADTAKSEPVDLTQLNLKSEIVVDRKVVLEHEVLAEQEDAALPASPAEPAVILAVPAPPELAISLPSADVPEAAATMAAESSELGLAVAQPPAAPEEQALTMMAPIQIAQANASRTPPQPLPAEDVPVAAAVAAVPAKVAVPAERPQTPAFTNPKTHTAKPGSGAAPLAAQPVQTIETPTPVSPDLPITGVIFIPDTSTTADGSGQSLQVAGAAPMSAPVQSAPQAVPATAPPLPLAPANGIVTVSPAHVVDIVSQSIEDGQSDRVVVQLDPPELGRVSIDFKFDAQGLQHVTITGETPEAIRQLRMMHSDLVQALERQGLGSQNMTFQQQQQQAQHSPAANPFARQAAFADAGTGLAPTAPAPVDHPTTARTPPGGRIDIRL